MSANSSVKLAVTIAYKLVETKTNKKSKSLQSNWIRNKLKSLNKRPLCWKNSHRSGSTIESKKKISSLRVLMLEIWPEVCKWIRSILNLKLEINIKKTRNKMKILSSNWRARKLRVVTSKTKREWPKKELDPSRSFTRRTKTLNQFSTSLPTKMNSLMMPLSEGHKNSAQEQTTKVRDWPKVSDVTLAPKNC